MLEEYLKKTEPEYYPPVENLLDLIYEHYTENNPVEKNTVAGKAAKAKDRLQMPRLNQPDDGQLTMDLFDNLLDKQKE